MSESDFQKSQLVVYQAEHYNGIAVGIGVDTNYERAAQKANEDLARKTKEYYDKHPEKNGFIRGSFGE